MRNIKKCPSCYQTGENIKRYKLLNIEEDDSLDFQKGFIEVDNNETNCPYCNTLLIDIGMSCEDFNLIKKISKNNRHLLEALVELSENNIIEYEIQMNQFRLQEKQIEAFNNKKELKEGTSHKQQILKCPKCGSTNITTGARGANWAFGFIGASKTVNRCGNCGHTWKP